MGKQERPRRTWRKRQKRRNGLKRKSTSALGVGNAVADNRAQALVMAEYEEAFEKPQYGVKAGRGSGFVRAGGQ